MQKIQIDCFLAAADSGSIASAANKLYMSTQAVSQNIQNLEKETGSRLFTRSKNGVVLTQEGETFYSYAIKWTGLFLNTKKKIESHYQSLTASFSIGISEYVDVLGNISSGIAAFKENHADTVMQGEQSKNSILFEKIVDGSLDVAIINEMQIVTGGDFIIHPFAKEDLRLYVHGFPEVSRNTSLNPGNPANDICKSYPGQYQLWDLECF